MPLRRAQSEEEREAKAQQKDAEREAKARQKAAAEDQARLRKEAEQRERERQGFFASPGGEARTAYERGDRLFQFVIDVANTQAVVIPMGSAKTATTTKDPVAILNSVCNEGWELVNGSFVFHELGSESRDKFLASGQHVAVRGTVIGYYLFRRSEANKLGSRDPWDVPQLERACPHCGAKMHASATVCQQCHSPSDPWQFQHGQWWRTVDGEWHFLNPAGEWEKHSAGSAAKSDSAEG